MNDSRSISGDVSEHAAPKRILFLIDGMQSPYAGTESQLVKLISGLSERGVEIVLLAMARSSYLQSKSLACEIDILDRTRVASISTWLSLINKAIYYRRRGFKVVHMFFNDSALLGPFIFRLMGYKTITSRRDMGIWYTPFKLSWLRVNRRFTSAYIANSCAVKSYICASEKARPEQVKVIYNGYLSQNGVVEAARVPFEGSDVFVFGIVANLRPVKRIADAIRALAIVVSQHPRARLVVVGNQDPRDPSDFNEITTELGLDSFVFFAGRQSNVSSWIKMFDVGLLCSESEGFSNAIIEYLQQGKPVICSNVGGNAEIVHNGTNGYLYEMGDVQELAEKMALLINDDELLARLRKQTTDSVSSRFSLDSMIDEHLIMYNNLVRLKSE